MGVVTSNLRDALADAWYMAVRITQQEAEELFRADIFRIESTWNFAHEFPVKVERPVSLYQVTMIWGDASATGDGGIPAYLNYGVPDENLKFRFTPGIPKTAAGRLDSLATAGPKAFPGRKFSPSGARVFSEIEPRKFDEQIAKHLYQALVQEGRAKGRIRRDLQMRYDNGDYRFPTF